MNTEWKINLCLLYMHDLVHLYYVNIIKRTKDELLKSALFFNTQTWIPSNNSDLLNNSI